VSLILEQIRKAEKKAGAIDIEQVVDDARGQAPITLASAKEKQERHQFLRDSLQDVAQADKYFERILLGNELQDVNYLERGAIAARAVARIAIRRPNGALAGWGTGFLVAPGVLLTNHHVLPDNSFVQRSEAQFGFERDYNGVQRTPQVFAMRPNVLYFADQTLDFAIVAIASNSDNSEVPLASFGHLPLLATTGKVSEGEWLSIIQHPNGELKQVCVRENKLVKRTENELWYSTDTLGGSSGSPVFNNDWYVVALHHSGVPHRVDGKIQTVDGRDYDPTRDGEERIHWIANEGIRVSRIVQRLCQQHAQHPLLQPLFAATPESARLASGIQTGNSLAAPVSIIPPVPESPAMPNHDFSVSPRSITVTLTLDAEGNVALAGSSVAQEAALTESSASKKRPLPFDVPFNAKYDDRKGFQAAFLDKAILVHLPQLSPALEAKASHLLQPANGNKYVLHYHNYSVVMHRERRFAMYSAANVRYDQRFDMGRPSDVWRTDPRIPEEHQVGNFYYKSNQFDRGHLTRREDLEFGTTAKAALVSAADTCHWTNCTPQHARFNQNKELWQGLERYVLEEGLLRNQLQVQVFTGPILEEDDPVYKPFPKIQYPVRFWKVLATLDADGELFATAYILDQSDVIAQYGIEEAAPYGAYKTFQVNVTEVERLTGLTFTCEVKGQAQQLSDFDPLPKSSTRIRRRRTPVVSESLPLGIEGDPYELGDVTDIILR
jgi:endonuclease G, mitochondrial